MPGPKLSVCMISYQHEPYIRQAVQSVFEQQTDFRIQLVIGEDKSPDGTAEILRGLEPPAHVDLKLRCNTSNLGMMGNFMRTLEECEGEYIALLEGDDYWSDPAKLQRQVAFLDSHPECAICFHPVEIDDGSGVFKPDTNRAVGELSDIFELARGNFMHTCSVVFRRGLFGEFPESFRSSSVGDYFLHMLNARHGKIGRLPGVMARYRVHAGGVWSLQPNMDLKILSYLEAMMGCFEPEVEALLKRRHQDIAFRSLLNRAGEAGFDARLARALRYGNEAFQPGFEELVRIRNESRRSPLGRLLGPARPWVSKLLGRS